jgi:uncharacterized protein (DUF885 family)
MQARHVFARKISLDGGQLPRRLVRSLLVPAWVVLTACSIVFVGASANQSSSQPDSLDVLAKDFWDWRYKVQPFSADDIPRIERPVGVRDWSPSSIAKQRAALGAFEARWKGIKGSGWSISRRVDYRLMGSAIERVKWELDVNCRWQRDPTFYLGQTLTAVLEALVEPPPFNAPRSREILARMQDIPRILEDGKINLRPVRPFAQLAVAALRQIRPELSRVQKQVGPMLQPDAAQPGDMAVRFKDATEKATVALESYRDWLRSHLDSMSDDPAIGRLKYQFFLNNVALLPYDPEQLLSISRLEWQRAVAFEQLETQRNTGLPELKPAASVEEQVKKSERDELAIRRFLVEKGILTVPPENGHYTVQLVPDYLAALSDFGELDDFLHHTGVRWVSAPSPSLGYFWLASAKDPRPDMVHEGVPGHFFQLSVSRVHEDPIRRQYYDSGPNEGLGFYVEEMLLQAGLFDDSPRSREIIYNFMRLRALRVEVDVKLALGLFTTAQAADYLTRYVPMDLKTAEAEAASFATNPGQAITYQIGKVQIVRFLADAKLRQGEAFRLRVFDDYLWKNGNVPLALQRWEYLGLDDDLNIIDQREMNTPARKDTMN